MKVTISEGELYPYMYVNEYEEGEGRCYEIPDELWERYRKTSNELWELNEIFQKIEEKEEEKIRKNDN